MYSYTWYQWLTFFYLYCFAGWIFESAYVSILKKRLVNRGFLRLPLLPHTSQTNRVLAHQQNTAFCSFSSAPAREAARFSRP